MKKIASFCLALMCVFSTFVGSAAAYEDGPREERYIKTVISTEEEIREYLAEQGEPYDPDLVEVIRIEAVPEAAPDPAFIIREYYIKNKRTSRFTDFSYVVKEYLREAGKVAIKESVTISNSYSASGKINADILEATLGFDVTSSDEFLVEWEETYSYPVRITVYPRYEKITGEIWDEDIQFDDYVGEFTALRALGDDVRVYRR